jgi:hypothetical protein
VDPLAALVPQIAQYEAFVKQGLNWLPYVMYFNPPDYRSAVINTDSGGFRLSRNGAHRYSLRDHLPAGPVSLVMGGSSAFGFGSSSDDRTLAAMLSQNSSATPWLNLAAPAFNSTQEVVLFLQNRHLLPEIRDIVVYSGFNNLVLAGLPGATENYGQFFFSGEFYDQLNGQATSKAAGVTHTPGPGSPARDLLTRLSRRRNRNSEATPAGPSPAQRVEIGAGILAKDLDRLLELAGPTGARVHFVLQPTVAWTGKTRSPEEIVLLDDRTAAWARMWNFFEPVFDRAVYAEHTQRVEQLCKSRGISFLDMNAALQLSPQSQDWLFVDAVHLNDFGTSTVVEIIKKELALH